jgi:hypothetical protein
MGIKASPIRKGERVRTDVDLISAAQNKCCQDTDIVAFRKHKSTKKPGEKTCQLLHSPTNQFHCGSLMDIPMLVKFWAMIQVN